MRDFNYSVDILVKAYLNDTLQHGSCCACAVGNLVADAMRYKYRRDSCGALVWANVISSWSEVFSTCYPSTIQSIRKHNYEGIAKLEIDSTGYTWQELARIEHAFETAPTGLTPDEWMFNGLMAVVDVLADIHGIDITEREEAKLLFVKP